MEKTKAKLKAKATTMTTKITADISQRWR
jgi:hypothetical protein